MKILILILLSFVLTTSAHAQSTATQIVIGTAGINGGWTPISTAAPLPTQSQ